MPEEFVIQRDERKVKKRALRNFTFLLILSSWSIYHSSVIENLTLPFMFYFMFHAYVKWIVTPIVQLSETTLRVHHRQISTDNIDFDKSVFTKKKLTLYFQEDSWKDPLKADISLLCDEDIQKLKDLTWNK